MMPLHDWQFWIVTLLALAAGLWMLRALWPRRSSTQGDASCSNCANGSASQKSKRRVALTIEKKRI